MNNIQFLLMSGGSGAEGSAIDFLGTFLPFAIVIVVFYFLLIRPQQKKDKEDRAMRENLEIGDEIITAGGIVGLVVSIKEDTVVIETGSDRSKIRIAKWAVAQNITAKEKAGK